MKLDQLDLGLALTSQKPLPLLQVFGPAKEIHATYDEKSKLLVFEQSYGPYTESSMPLTASPVLYRERLQEGNSRRLWRESTLSYRKKEAGKQSGGLLQFEIPWNPPRLIKSILGEGGAGLKVNGYRKISFSGRSQWTDQVTTATSRQSKFPSLNMEQISRFEIKGTIGSKIFVDVHQDSKQQQALANRIQLRYKGEEDDIVKTIELGNTNLSLPNTRFLGYSQSVQGLFGVKTTAQVGPITLTAIISQEKSNTQGANFTAGADSRLIVVRDYSYLEYTYFDLTRRDSVGLSLADLAPGDSITTLKIYLPPLYADDPTATLCSLFVDPFDKSRYGDEFGIGQFLVYSDSHYTFHPTDHYMIFNYSPNLRDKFVGVYMEVVDANGVSRTIGDISQPDRKILKLLKHAIPRSTYITWQYEWRNVYSLGSTQIEDPRNLQIKVYKGKATNVSDRDAGDIDNKDKVTYLQLLGLDVNNDGFVDPNPAILDVDRGHLKLPRRRPFADPALGDTVPAIYNSTNDSEHAIDSKYYFLMKSSSRESEFRLGHFDIVEGSEVVTVNGRQLTRGTDYDLSYQTGSIRFLAEEAFDPNANITVNYEYAPTLQLEKKTLLGVRGEYEASKSLKVGSTILYKSEKTTDRKPRLGEEQWKFMNFDADFSYNSESKTISRVFDALPLLKVKDASRVDLRGEVARSFPTPNVKGEAYIDDFEGSRERVSLGVTREGWHLASPPFGKSPTARGKLIWYNPYNQYRVTDIYDREVKAGDDRTHVLVLRFTPNSDDLFVSFAGVMKALSKGFADQSRTQFIELRMRGTRGRLHIDLGEISEDIDGDGVFDREDKNKNGLLDADEDVGLDGLSDAQEKALCDSAKAPPGYDCSSADPAGDNFSYDASDPENYEHLNGTEGNAKDPSSYGYWDTEDFDRNSAMISNRDHYYSYSFDLADNPFKDTGSVRNGWYTVRVPFRDRNAYQAQGSPDSNSILFARIWIDNVGVVEPTVVEVAEIELTRNVWEIQPVLTSIENRQDTASFKVSVINTEENADYSPPSGVEGFYDKTTGLRETEQSIRLVFKNFAPGDTGFAERVPYRPQNLTGYQKLEMFVHGDSLRENVQFFFRAGPDEKSFYEYRSTIKPGWDPSNHMQIAFDQITPLKLKLKDLKELYPDSVITEITSDDGHHRIVGDPSLTRIQHYSFGVINTDTTGEGRVSGTYWLDELRVTDVRDDRGLAGFINGSLTLGRLLSVQANYEKQDPFYRKLSEVTSGGNLASGYETRSYGYNLSFQLADLIPKALGFKGTSCSYRWSKVERIPHLVTGQDIVVPEEKVKEQTETSTSQGFSVSSIRFEKATRNPLFTLLLNKFSITNFSYGKSRSVSPSVPLSESENYTSQGRYSISRAAGGGVKIFWPLGWLPLPKGLTNARFNPIPTSLAGDGTLNRNKTLTINSSGGVQSSYIRTFKGNMTMAVDPFSTLRVNYTMRTDRDLDDPKLIHFSFNPKKFQLGQERTFGEELSATFTPKGFPLLPFITATGLNFRSTHSENLDPQARTDGTRKVDNSRSYGAQASLDLKRIVGTNKVPEIRKQPVPRKEEQKIMRGRQQSDTLKAPIDTTKTGVPKSPGDTTLTGARPQSADSTAADTLSGKNEKLSPSQDTLPGTPVYVYPLRLIRSLTDRVEPFAGTYGHRETRSLDGFLERPSLLFRLGLSRNPQATKIARSGVGSQFDQQSRGDDYGLRSGVQLPLGVAAKTSLNYGTTESFGASNDKRDEKLTFPDISFDFARFVLLKFTKIFASSFSLSSRYSRSVTSSENLSKRVLSARTTSKNFGPLAGINISWKFSSGFQSKIDLTRSITDREQFNEDPLNNYRQQLSRDITSTWSVQTSYTFQAGKKVWFPLLGKVKMQSSLSFTLDVSKRVNRQELFKPGYHEVTQEQSDFTVQPQATYSFSSNVKGGFRARWQDSNNLKTNRNSHVRELGFWVDITF